MNETDSGAPRSDRVLFAFRLLVALLVAVHGWHRLLDGGSAVFGEWLQSQGVPLAWLVAWGVTLGEVAGSACLALGVCVRPFCVLFIGIYATGVAMIHAAEGWFVVVPGRNGMEFSLLLIGSLALVALRIHHPLWHALPRKRWR